MTNLRLYVTTSDYYNHLIPGFAHLLNRYWSANQEVTFLCYTKPSYSLPNNFSVFSLGPPATFGNEIPEWSEGRRGVHDEPYPTPRWTDSLIPVVENMTDEHFILMQIDCFINRPVELDKIELLRSFLNFSDVAKIDLTLDRTFYTHYLYAIMERSRSSSVTRTPTTGPLYKRQYGEGTISCICSSQIGVPGISRGSAWMK